MADPTAAPAVVAPPVVPALGTPEHDAAMVAKFDAAQGTPSSTPPPADAAKPEGLPEKFKSVADMATAYAELEKKLGQQGKPAETAPPVAKTTDPEKGADKLSIPDTKAAEEATAKAGVDFSALQTEYNEKGALSEDTYKKLADGGIPKEMVDSYIEGQKALAATAAAAYDNAAFEQAGGQDKYTAMVQWAAQGGIPQAKAQEFNAAVESGNQDKMRLAVATLRSAYEAANGVSPNLLKPNQAATSVSGYESIAQMKADMRDPKYSQDPAFRKQVEAKIEASNLWSVQERT